jgi:hypothetical protein
MSTNNRRMPAKVNVADAMGQMRQMQVLRASRQE